MRGLDIAKLSRTLGCAVNTLRHRQTITCAFSVLGDFSEYGERFRESFRAIVPDVDSEPLLQEALMSYFTTSNRVDDLKAWLVAAACNASRHYWRRRVRREHVEGIRINELVNHPDVTDLDRLERTILVRGLLDRLRPHQREVLRLHYFEGLTAPEIAEKLDTTPAYAGKLLGKALAKLRALYCELHQSNGLSSLKE